MIEEMPDFLDDTLEPHKRLVNWDKCVLLGDVFHSLTHCKVKYCYKQDSEILRLISEKFVMTEEEISEIAKEVRAHEESVIPHPHERRLSKSSLRSPSQNKISIIRRNSSKALMTMAPTGVNIPQDYEKILFGSDTYNQFKASLEESKRPLLDLYQDICTFENHFEWTNTEILTVFDGICNNFLGFAEKPSVIRLTTKEKEELLRKRENPSMLMFTELKQSVLSEIHIYFKQFHQSKLDKAMSVKKSSLTNSL